MRIVFVSLLIVGAWGKDIARPNQVGATDDSEDNSDTELKLVFTIFRHGDRTPDEDELDAFPAQKLNSSVFFPYGMKALTNRGKQRGYSVGKYMRKQYDGFISPLYLTDEMVARTTSYARTKMTALTALASLYAPPPAQKWNPMLNWQPVPYNTPDFDRDDLMYYYNCPRYIKLRNDAYNVPAIAERIKSYQDLFQYLQNYTGNNITTTEQVFYLDNLLQTLNNVNIEPPMWAQNVMPQIKEVTKLDYAIQFYSPELIRLASGVLMDEILNATNCFIAGNTEQPKLRLYSAHENNVAALMAASRVFEPHQPSYGATFALELWQRKASEQYSIKAVYAKDAGGPGVTLSIKGCGGGDLCDYDKFVQLVKEYTLSKSDYYRDCKNDC